MYLIQSCYCNNTKLIDNHMGKIDRVITHIMAQNYWDISCPTYMTLNALDRWLIKESIIPQHLRQELIANNNQNFPIDLIDSFLNLSINGNNEDVFCLENDEGLIFDPSLHKIVRIITFNPTTGSLNHNLQKIKNNN